MGGEGEREREKEDGCDGKQTRYELNGDAWSRRVYQRRVVRECVTWIVRKLCTVCMRASQEQERRGRGSRTTETARLMPANLHMFHCL